MKQTVTFSDFTDAFRNHDRQEQFSYKAKRALFDYLEQYEEETGEEIELDVIALCCDYVEMDADEVIDNYGLTLDAGLNDEEKHDAIADFLWEKTVLVTGFNDCDNGGKFVFLQF